MRLQGKSLKRILTAAICTVLLAMPATALAAGETIENVADNSVTLQYLDRNNAPIDGLRVRIYQVATAKGEIYDGASSGYTLSYELTPEFKQFEEGTGLTPVTGFSEQRLNEELIIRPGETVVERRARWQAIAATLRPYALADLWPTDFQYTSNGRVNFTNLYPGLYLVIADDRPVKEDDADYRYRYQPTFVAVPGYANGAWNHSVDFSFDNNSVLRVKYTYTREVYGYKVYKRWYNDNVNIRPREVRVDIYRDGVLYRTVYLNESNNWTYDWDAGSGNWYVVERTTGSDYSVNISEKEGAFTLDNTYNPPPDNPPPPEEPPEVQGVRRDPVTEEPEVLGMRRLPQTGQLNWPVPVLAIAGLVLFGTGFYRNRRNA